MSETNESLHQNALDAQIEADEKARSTTPVEETAKTAEDKTEGTANGEEESAEEETADDHSEENTEYEKRIARLAYKEREASRIARRLEAENARLRGLSPANHDEDVQQEIERRATEMAAIKAYNDKANGIAAKGQNEFPDFNDKLAAFREVGGISPQFVEAADEAGDAHKIIHYLGKNIDEADRIMKLSPASMGAALAKLSAKLSAPPAAPVKAQSKAAAPIKPISGRVKNEVPDIEKPIDEYMRLEDERMRGGRFRR